MTNRGRPLRRFFRADKGARKNFALKISCNPLISIDSDERIQGNPTPQTLGFRSETATFQENPNRVDEQRRARRQEGAKPSIRMHSALGVRSLYHDNAAVLTGASHSPIRGSSSRVTVNEQPAMSREVTSDPVRCRTTLRPRPARMRRAALT